MKDEPLKHAPKQSNNLPKPPLTTTAATTLANTTDTTNATCDEAPVKEEHPKVVSINMSTHTRNYKNTQPEVERLKKMKGTEMRGESTRIKVPIRAPIKESRYSSPSKNDERRWEKQDDRKEAFRRDDVKSASGNNTPTTGSTNVLASNSGSKHYSRGDDSPRKSKMTYEDHHNRHRSVENNADRGCLALYNCSFLYYKSSLFHIQHCSCWQFFPTTPQTQKEGKWRLLTHPR